MSNEVDRLKDQFLAHLREKKLFHLFEGKEGLIRPSIHLMTVRSSDETELAIGQSKIGGQPDLPPGIEWPVVHKSSLGFVAQINVFEAKPFDVENSLPETGILYFFCGWELPDNGWKVLYYDGDLSLLIFLL